MTNAELNLAMADHLRRCDLIAMPDSVIDRDGRVMDLSQSVWKFNVPTEHSALDWARLPETNPIVIYALRRWALQLLTQRASASVATALRSTIYGLIGRVRDGDLLEAKLIHQWSSLASVSHIPSLQVLLRHLVEQSLQVLRERKALDLFYPLRSWYRWSAEILECLGFDEEFAFKLDEIRIPAPYSRLPVELEDEHCGPLSDTELMALRRALRDDHSMERSHVMQRAAIALSLAYGRNPGNYCLLREADFQNSLEGFDVPPNWVLSIPRIKKRGRAARQEFIDERVGKDLERILKELLRANECIDCGPCARPLFMHAEPDAWRCDTGVGEYAHHITVAEFLMLIRRFGMRMNVISPRTKAPLHLSSRRLRYTFATTMVELGVSRRVLAAMLDHSDTQSVHVYYALKGRRLTDILDRAAAVRLGPLLKLFRGQPASEDSVAGSVPPHKRVHFLGDMHAVPDVEIGACGKSQRCDLDPPFSCYVCPKFRPYVEADHEAVLAELLRSRQERRERYGERVAIQMDEVIYAVGEVVQEVARYGKRAGKTT
jgi:integrase